MNTARKSTVVSVTASVAGNGTAKVAAVGKVRVRVRAEAPEKAVVNVAPVVRNVKEIAMVVALLLVVDVETAQSVALPGKNVRLAIAAMRLP
ncbi:MAG: hypothetical protein ACAI34_11970 [Verrucomicrobium sp.]|nr:hypothetical protein [Verrucomicrobium sp.]